MAEQPVTVTLDEERWEKIQALTHGAASLCYQCGMCTASCPWGRVRDIGLSVRRMVRQAQLGLWDEGEDLWRCTTCGRCEITCPRGVRIRDVIRGLRYLAWEERRVPAGFPSMLWSVYWNDNPWSQPPSHRVRWAEKLEVPRYSPEQDVLLYLGCTVSYDHRARKIARSLIHLLKRAGVAFGILGEAEPCCGEPVLAVGHLLYFRDLMARNIERFRERGVTRIVTVSPHCYDTLKNHYDWPEEHPVQVEHYTELLFDLLQNKRLKVHRRAFDGRVAYHDPCYLARYNGVIEAPRACLAAVVGDSPVELEYHREWTLCCGGGGGRMWLETRAEERFSNLRIRDAREKGVRLLLTACPMCLTCLEDSRNALGISALKVLDIAELLEQSMEE